MRSTHLAGEAVQHILSRAPGNDAPIGGVKVIAESGWFAARPSGTEDIYKIYAESFRGEDHLRRIVEEAQAIVDGALEGGVRRPLKEGRQDAARHDRIGRMGANMVRRLLRGGHECVVYDVHPEAVQALVSEGAVGATSLDDLVAAS